ncbi:EKC/KEOPS complex subunit Tprkb-like [Limulus polyphemus]|uniref:EKC/KEOPS complex subunit Tprkb-like n=1 Tax=Limulus polyphemus TaxID=6850 RepID=A0ABM1BPP1_LIMPO|nr:EKC/KEOPS complex subunit Tprkb-like [Limulus polyphemus]
MSVTLELDKSLKVKITLTLFSDVTNSKELRQKLVEGSLQCSIIKPSLVLDTFQLLVAANKAVLSQQQGTLKTKGIYSEILYNLSPSKNITESLKTFGIGENDTSILVLVLNDIDGTKVNSISSVVKGKLASLDTLNMHTNEQEIKKVYKIKEAEQNCGSLLGSLVSRIAVKEIISI